MKKLNFLKVTYFIRKDRLLDGEAPIYLRIFLEGQRIKISINKKIDIENWDDLHGRAKGSDKESIVLNNFLDKTRLNVLAAYNDLVLHNEDVTADRLRDKRSGSDEPKKKAFHSFLK